MTNTPGSKNDNISIKGSTLIERTLYYASELSFEEGASEDMLSVFSSIVEELLTSIFERYAEDFETLNSDQLQQFKNCFYESIGIGYKIYWSERKFLKDEHKFRKFEGDEFKNFLLSEYRAYFISESKNPEPSTPPYVVEAINYFGILLFNGALVDNDNSEILKKLLGNDDFFEKVDITGLLKSLILAGYILSKSQDKYKPAETHKTSSKKGLLREINNTNEKNMNKAKTKSQNIVQKSLTKTVHLMSEYQSVVNAIRYQHLGQTTEYDPLQATLSNVIYEAENTRRILTENKLEVANLDELLSALIKASRSFLGIVEGLSAKANATGSYGFFRYRGDLKKHDTLDRALQAERLALSASFES